MWTSAAIDASDCLFRSNSTDFGAGAVFLNADRIFVFRGCEFRGNETSSGASGAVAASMTNAQGSVIIEECLFRDNVGQFTGGFSVTNAGSHHITNSIFVGNSTTSLGGSAARITGSSGSGSLLIEGCFASGNAVASGATFANASSGSMTLINCTVINNTNLTGFPGGVVAINGPVNITNSIVTNNESVIVAVTQSDNVFQSSNGTLEVFDSLIGSLGFGNAPPAGMRNFDGDPLFVNPLENDGIAGTPDDQPAIGPNSPAIDRGNSIAVGPNLSSDVLGNPRFADDTGTPDTGISDGVNPIVDVGAAEFLGTSPPACPPDLAAPFGVLNFFDIAAFIGLYNAGDPAADLAAPFGSLNFFDIAEFIALFNAGCP